MKFFYGFGDIALALGANGPDVALCQTLGKP
jgi:hypothetical protein